MNKTVKLPERSEERQEQGVPEKCACGCGAIFEKGTGIRDTLTQGWYATPAHRSNHRLAGNESGK